MKPITGLGHVLLLFCLLLIPKTFERFRLPGAITAFALGLIASLGFGWFQSHARVTLVSGLIRRKPMRLTEISG